MKRDRALMAGRGPALPALVLVAMLVQLMVACGVLGGGDGDAYPAPEVVDDTSQPAAPSVATLTCSQECADRGQCGQSVDRGTVVLLSADEPAVSPADFELAVAEGSGVSVLETRLINIVESGTGFEFPVNFYRVLILDRNVEGWVAAWCLLNPPQAQ